MLCSCKRCLRNHSILFVNFYSRPFESCLYPHSSASRDLRKVLDLWSFAHKYCAFDIIERAKSVALSLVTLRTIRTHLTPQCPALRVLEMSRLVECPELATMAKEVILADLDAGRVTERGLLDLADNLGDVSFRGRVYYRAMLLERALWATSLKFSPMQVERLIGGLVRSQEVWNNLLMDWTWSGIPHTCGPNGHKFQTKAPMVYRLLSRMKHANIPINDILAMTDQLDQMEGINGCQGSLADYGATLKACLMKEMQDWFSPLA